MCGIFGTVSLKSKATYSGIKAGLEKLSYRGYDSAGIAVLHEQGILVSRCEGHPKFLQDNDMSGKVALGHNRWATHSPPTKENSHPYVSNDNKIYLVHNGIIENYVEIKEYLSSKGYTFYSETDTEVVPNLIQYHLEKTKDLKQAMKNTAAQIVGAYGVIFIHTDYPEQLNLMKLGSPMYIGRCEGKSEVYVSSDNYSFPESVDVYHAVDDQKICIIGMDTIDLEDYTGNKIEAIFDEQTGPTDLYTLGGYDHYMQKEIFEQVDYIRSCVAGRVVGDKIKLGGLDDCIFNLGLSKIITYTGCGSAFLAACVGGLAMEEVGNIPVRVLPSGELKYYNSFIDDQMWLVVVSQSGETADVIGCIKEFQNKGANILGIINTPSSTIHRMTDCGIHIRAGKEISVASTKAVTNQILSMLMMAYRLGLENGCTYVEYKRFCDQVLELPDLIAKITRSELEIKKTAEDLINFEKAYVLGRNVLEFVAKETALKIKEISYIHAEGYSASELKHGPIALIDEEMLSICYLDKHSHPEKMISNIEEIKARGGKILLITNYKKEVTNEKIYDIIINIETTENKFLNAIIFNVVGQLLSYNFALLKDRNVDLPRNLAKSVTVE